MGGCVGKCLPLPGSQNRSIPHQDSIDFSFLIEESSTATEENKRSFLSRLFSKKKNRKNSKQTPVLQLVDGILNPQANPYSRLNESNQISKTSSYNSKDIPLQCLDARALLARTTTSTPASSLDLEWEHETIPISSVHDPSGISWVSLPEEEPIPSPTESNHNSLPPHESDSDWSRLSSANSLEWDNVQNPLNSSPPASEVDTDTQLLLSEIERLTSKTLRETGHDLFS